MPATQLLFYKEGEQAPVVEWLKELRRRDRMGFAKCAARIRELAQFGHELRRPSADILQNGIYELRVKHGHIQYRILYFFHGRNVAVLGHAIVKEGSAVPKVDLERALRRKEAFERNPQVHTFEADVELREDHGNE